ncbi:hypothetical protein SBF1_860005 [Candidatus Desulfosporosinus infrequens]|uniref:Uncharacterized protein n=1 Tax=Candidatus Desulfosporosinus infrequens TaxID=2043169 RepID=A0A2U3LUZ4_9FIRM|nr:hypothetical protein SBF1_860005 [Candidatus Desulfosporosinus infrequens]
MLGNATTKVFNLVIQDHSIHDLVVYSIIKKTPINFKIIIPFNSDNLS